MARLTRSLLAAVLAAPLAACGGPADPTELAEDVVAALHSPDFDGFMENLVASPQEVLEVCPSETYYEVNQSEHREAFDNCLARADFGSVEEITQVLPTFSAPSACSPGVEGASDIRVTVVTKAEIYTFEIRSALQTENGWKVTDRLKCPEKK